MNFIQYVSWILDYYTKQRQVFYQWLILIFISRIWKFSSSGSKLYNDLTVLGAQSYMFRWMKAKTSSFRLTCTIAKVFSKQQINRDDWLTGIVNRDRCLVILYLAVLLSIQTYRKVQKKKQIIEMCNRTKKIKKKKKYTEKCFWASALKRNKSRGTLRKDLIWNESPVP